MKYTMKLYIYIDVNINVSGSRSLTFSRARANSFSRRNSARTAVNKISPRNCRRWTRKSSRKNRKKGASGATVINSRGNGVPATRLTVRQTSFSSPSTARIGLPFFWGWLIRIMPGWNENRNCRKIVTNEIMGTVYITKIMIIRFCNSVRVRERKLERIVIILWEYLKYRVEVCRSCGLFTNSERN